MKLWGGRFKKNTSEILEEFNSSIDFDKRLYKQDIEGSIAHIKGLLKAGYLTEEEFRKIYDGLMEILREIEEGKIEFSISNEDIHMNIESLLIDKIGDVAKKLHTGRSRNDQVALDFRMYIKEEIDEISNLLVRLLEVLIKKAEENLDLLMPSYTHLQRAQPILFSHHMMAYFWMFSRDIERLMDAKKRVDIMPLGSGAVAGTTYKVDREYLRDLLGFAKVSLNSMDAVGDRDFAIEFLSCLSIIMMHLSRFCEELIIWSSSEFGFVEMDDSYATGSSMMPQKKNPDAAELIRGKTGRVYGNLIALLTVMKGLPLSYNKDLQEDKEAVFDAVDTVKMCLTVFSGMVETMMVKKDKMDEAVKSGFLNATDVADYLAKKGVPFRKAHEIVGKMVLYLIESNKTFEDLSLEEYKKFSPHFEEDIFEKIKLINCINERDVIGGTAVNRVKEAIEMAKEFIGKYKKHSVL